MNIIEEIKNISISNYNYPLPDEKIALHPLPERDNCRLLYFPAGADAPKDYCFADLPALLPQKTILVWNNTRVINARMKFRKPTGAQIEIFLLEPIAPTDYALTFQCKEKCRWSCLVGNLKRWKEGALTKPLTLPSGKEIILSATLGGDLPGNAREIEFSWDDPEVTFAEVVDAAGYIPIPPYLNRESEATDAEDYQTVYARHKGSVAAPTAGLHFTPQLIERLEAEGTEMFPLTLHVGAGTFQPVKAARIGDHPMHTEVFTISRRTLEGVIRAIESGRPITAVGTTSVRTLESLPILGGMIAGGDMSLNVGQWDAYLSEDKSKENTLCNLHRLLDYINERGGENLTASTSIMIAPGFRWRIVDAMITNFHQPESTLLLLVSSFSGGTPQNGGRWREVYDHALAHGYRFLSYGDACLFTRNK